MEQIKIKYHVKDIPKLKKIDKGDWIDLCAVEDVLINEGAFKLISLGISMKLPEGYEAHIVPRSSTFKNWGIIQTNHMGVVDQAYCGENDVWKFPAYCLKGSNDGITYGVDKQGKLDKTCPLYGVKPFSEIKKGDRICQFRIMKKQPEIEFIEVDYMEDESRGGFGSTGV